jgi:AbiV family abortive infection protein
VQVVQLQDALLANADRLLRAALAVLDLGSVGLARSLAILAMESGKAIAIHERRVQIAYAPEPFVTRLSRLWADHQSKLELVYEFLADEQYWFGVDPPDPLANRAYLGTIKRWTTRHDNLKKRGFHVEIDRVGNVLAPTGVADKESLADVIAHVHQIGWQLRLGEHIEAKGQAQQASPVPPASERRIERMRRLMAEADPEIVEDIVHGMREGDPGRPLNNDAYRLKLPDPGTAPFSNLGKPGYEAETRDSPPARRTRSGPRAH